MDFKLGMNGIVEAFDGYFPHGSVYPFDLTVFPRMFHLCKSMLDTVFLTSHVKHADHVPCCRSIGIAPRKGELGIIVRKNGMDPVVHGLNERHEEG